MGARDIGCCATTELCSTQTGTHWTRPGRPRHRPPNTLELPSSIRAPALTRGRQEGRPVPDSEKPTTQTICTGTTRFGQPCQAWAVAGSQPPRCVRHGGRPAADGAPRCGALTRAGRPCQAWPIRGSDPPRCAAHLERDKTGLKDNGPPLKGRVISSGPGRGEQALLRQVRRAEATIDRLADYLESTPDLDAADLTRVAARVFDGARTIATLLRARHAIGGDTADGVSVAVAQALDELSREWGVEL